MFSAFANARIQGWDKFYRTYIEPMSSNSRTSKKELAWSWAKLLMSAGAATLLLWSLNRDEDWYKNEVKDWEKENFWIISRDLRIPKGFDFGLRFFSNWFEESLNYVFDKNPRAYESVWQPVLNELPDLLPTAIAPIFECMANYDLFRKTNIVPHWEKNNDKLKEYEKFDYRTSNFAKFVGKQFDISPRYVDHVLTGYTGNIGRETMRIADSLPVIGDKSYNAKFPKDIPIIGGLFRVPYKNPKVVSDYYKIFGEQKQLHEDYKKHLNPEGYDHKLFLKLSANEKAMKNLAKKEREVLNNTKLSSKEKDNSQLEIQKKRIEICKRALGRN